MFNTCSCPEPPGGQVVCELNQIAICNIQNGQVRHFCLDPIQSIKPEATINWLIEQITGEYRSEINRITNQEIAFLVLGKYTSIERDVTFSLPYDVKYALSEVISNRDRFGGRGGMDLGRDLSM